MEWIDRISLDQIKRLSSEDFERLRDYWGDPLKFDIAVHIPDEHFFAVEKADWEEGHTDFYLYELGTNKKYNYDDCFPLYSSGQLMSIMGLSSLTVISLHEAWAIQSCGSLLIKEDMTLPDALFEVFRDVFVL
ncbi:hypothetical protein [Brevibacillus porteri]|uniref:hypothetical protein n=1 Tax=Brevibacillus porteri TaxID=2126350 RepID=UPI003D1FB206